MTNQSNKTVRNIVIVGGGISGLILACTLKRLKTCVETDPSVEIAPYVFEKTFSIPNEKITWILWKWAVPALNDLGLGRFLQNYSNTISAVQSLDLLSNDLLVSYPPISSDGSIEKWDQTSSNAVVTINKFVLMEALLYVLKTGQAPPSDFNPLDSNYKPIDQNSINELKLGHELETYLISASTGTVTAHFKNGVSVIADMLVGCDGASSIVRESLLGNLTADVRLRNDGLIFSGTVDLNKCTDNNIDVNSLTTSLNEISPPNICRSFVGSSSSFGLIPINDKIFSWNLAVPQRVLKTVEYKLREGCKRYLEEQHKEINIPSNHKTNKVEDDIDADDIDASDLGLGDQLAKGIAQITIEDGDNHLDEEYAKFLNEPDFDIFNTENNFIPKKLIFDILIDLINNGAEGSSNLSNNSIYITPKLTNIIKASDLNSIFVNRMALIIESIQSFTSPKFHPGRVIILGDAAHSLPISPILSRGGNMAIVDANILAKMIYAYNPDLEPNEEKFHLIGSKFTQSRSFALKSLTRQRVEAEESVKNTGDASTKYNDNVHTNENSTVKKSGGFFHSLWKFSWKVTPTNFIRDKTKSLINDGGITDKEIQELPQLVI